MQPKVVALAVVAKVSCCGGGSSSSRTMDITEVAIFLEIAIAVVNLGNLVNLAVVSVYY